MSCDPCENLAEALAFCKRQPNPLNAFNDVVLHRGAYWSAQRQIGLAFEDPTVSTIVVAAGHSVGKSYFGAGTILGLSTLHRHSKVMTTSPSNTQLSGVLWEEVRMARNGSPLLKDAGRLTKLPNKYQLGDGWAAYGFATNKSERMQGFHAGRGGPLFGLVDEASGISDPAMWATIRSQKPRKLLMISNPLYDHGYFYEQARRAEDDPTVRLIRIPSTDSPDILLEESPRGLADARWLREMLADYGEDSQTYKVRVLAQFPDGGSDLLIPKAWLDRAERAEHVEGGPRRIAIDVSECQGGDPAVIVCRDDNGILDFRAGNRGGFEWQADQVAELAHKYSVDPSRIVFDENGPGADFASRLHWKGLVGCRPYRGSRKSKAPKWVYLRDAVYWFLRRRLDPLRLDDLNRQIPAFSIPPEFMKRLRFELKEITYETASHAGKIKIRDGDEVRAALRSSPNHADALSQSFMAPNS